MPRQTQKREILLDAGLLLLMENPPDKISMDDIAAAAGVTKPMVYYYFGSKLGYYRQLVEYVESSLQEMLTNSITPDITFKDLLRHIIECRIEQLISNPEISNAVRLMATSSTIGGASSRSRIVAVFNRLQPIFEQAVSRGEIRADAELHLVMGMVNFLLEGAVRIHGKKFYDKVTPAQFAELLVRQLFDGIGTGKRS